MANYRMLPLPNGATLDNLNVLTFGNIYGTHRPHPHSLGLLHEEMSDAARRGEDAFLRTLIGIVRHHAMKAPAGHEMADKLGCRGFCVTREQIESARQILRDAQDAVRCLA